MSTLQSTKPKKLSNRERPSENACLTLRRGHRHQRWMDDGNCMADGNRRSDQLWGEIGVSGGENWD